MNYLKGIYAFIEKMSRFNSWPMDVQELINEEYKKLISQEFNLEIAPSITWKLGGYIRYAKNLLEIDEHEYTEFDVPNHIEVNNRNKIANEEKLKLCEIDIFNYHEFLQHLKKEEPDRYYDDREFEKYYNVNVLLEYYYSLNYYERQEFKDNILSVWEDYHKDFKINIYCLDYDNFSNVIKKIKIRESAKKILSSIKYLDDKFKFPLNTSGQKLNAKYRQIEKSIDIALPIMFGEKEVQYFSWVFHHIKNE